MHFANLLKEVRLTTTMGVKFAMAMATLAAPTPLNDIDEEVTTSDEESMDPREVQILQLALDDTIRSPQGLITTIRRLAEMADEICTEAKLWALLGYASSAAGKDCCLLHLTVDSYAKTASSGLPFH